MGTLVVMRECGRSRLLVLGTKNFRAGQGGQMRMLEMTVIVLR
jgi:hypothetical protein